MKAMGGIFVEHKLVELLLSLLDIDCDLKQHIAFILREVKELNAVNAHIIRKKMAIFATLV